MKAPISQNQLISELTALGLSKQMLLGREREKSSRDMKLSF